MYVVEVFGDIPWKRKDVANRKTFEFYSEALNWIAVNFHNKSDQDLPDPEDDRIIIWEAKPGSELYVVWHFSGWHWDYEAHDLNGGPLDQGRLPGHNKSLYEIASSEY